MADTRRTLSALQALLADNTAGDISAQDMRDVLVSVFGAGLEPNPQTITTADVTGAVGQLYVCTIAGLTGHRNLTLPSATAGERVGVYIADGDATYTLILKGAASQTINGGSAATEWSRVFIQGELVIFTCTAANTWIVTHDGRMPMQCTLTLTTETDLTQTANTYFLPTDHGGAWTADPDVGGCADVSTSKITVRRACKAMVTVQTRSRANVTDQQYAGAVASLNGTTPTPVVYSIVYASVTLIPIVQAAKLLTLATGDTLQFMHRNQAADLGCSGATIGVVSMCLMEVL